jgi:hypothetical protein
MLLVLAFGSLIALALMLVITDGADERGEYLDER